MSTSPREIGTLIVVILKARNLPNKRHIGKQDPYCVIQLNGEKRRTKAIKRGGQHPEWDEEIRFTVYEGDDNEQPVIAGDGGTPPPPPPKKTSRDISNIQGGKFMGLACYAEDLKEPDFIGETQVDLTEVLTKGETDEWFTLMSKDKYSGEVYLELTFWSNEPAPMKKPSLKAKAKKQYGGPGTFIPTGEGRGSSESLNAGSQPSRWSMYSSGSWSGTSLNTYGSTTDTTRTDMRTDALPPSLRASSSIAQIGLYQPNYETSTSHTSSQNSISQQNTGMVDTLVNELGQMNMHQGLHRRMSLPQMSINDHLGTSASAPYLHQQATGYAPSVSSYTDDRSIHEHSRSPSINSTYQPYQQGTTNSQHSVYHPPYDPPSRSQSTHPGPPRSRLSLPSSSSGFVPLQSNSPVGYGGSGTPYQGLASATPAPSLYQPPRPPLSVAPTPAPSSYAPPTAPTPAPTTFNQLAASICAPTSYTSQPLSMPAPSTSMSAISQYHPPASHVPQSASYQSIPRSPSTYPYASYQHLSNTSNHALSQYGQAQHSQQGSPVPQQQFQQPPIQQTRSHPLPPSNVTPSQSFQQGPSPTPASPHGYQGPGYAGSGVGHHIPPPPPLHPSPSHSQGPRPLPEVPNGPNAFQRQLPSNIPPPPPVNGSIAQTHINYTTSMQIPPPPLPGAAGLASSQSTQAVPPPPQLPSRRRMSYHAGQQPEIMVGPPPPLPPLQRAPSAQAMYHNALSRQTSTGGAGHPLPQPPAPQLQYNPQQYQPLPNPPRPPSFAPTQQTYQMAPSATQPFSTQPLPSVHPGSLPVPPRLPHQQYAVPNGGWQ